MAFRAVKFVLAFFLGPSIIASQTIYVDRDSGYYALPCCAQIPLSIAVRDMSQGCGDDGHLTSYNCFCTTSYNYFSSLISTEVLEQCSGNVTDAIEAISVFNNYCAVGPSGTQLTASSTGSRIVCGSTSSPSPAGIATNSLPISTSTPTTTAPPPANTTSSSAVGKIRDRDGILMGVSLMLGLALLW